MSYLRKTHPDQTITCSFVLEKSQNALVHALTIPRMELQSAVLEVSMDNFIQAELNLPIKRNVS